jgi:hypothetical protein
VLPPVRDGIEYDVLSDVAPARELFAFAAAPCPPMPDGNLAWGARAASRLIGALLAERLGRAAFLYGPVIREHPDALDIAADLVTVAIGQASAAGIDTLFARPQGLDRIWIRFGFIPVPEGTLPGGLRGRPGAGLFAYRGGSAIWSVERSSFRGAEYPRSGDGLPSRGHEPTGDHGPSMVGNVLPGHDSDRL